MLKFLFPGGGGRFGHKCDKLEESLGMLQLSGIANLGLVVLWFLWFCGFVVLWFLPNCFSWRLCIP